MLPGDRPHPQRPGGGFGAGGGLCGCTSESAFQRVSGVERHGAATIFDGSQTAESTGIIEMRVVCNGDGIFSGI